MVDKPHYHMVVETPRPKSIPNNEIGNAQMDLSSVMFIFPPLSDGYNTI